MAKPTVTITLLTPISIRLSWTGSGDFEVWWKSDHPAGQEYAKLALVTGTSYDVGSLSWTTTYYFKVRNVGDEFSDEINVFICCGQAVASGPGVPVEGPPALLYGEYWQQSADADNGNVALAVKTKDDTAMLLYTYDGGSWKYRGGSPYDNQFQAAVRRIGDFIAVFDMQACYSDFGWYRFSTWDGYTFISGQLPPYDADDCWKQISLPSVTQCMVFNQDNRIVVAGCYVDWLPETQVNTYFLRYSLDKGNTWSDEIVIATFNSKDVQKIAITETDDGAVWIATTLYDKEVHESYLTMPTYAVYQIWKWTLAGGVVAVFNHTTELTSLYDNVTPPYPVIDPALFVSQCSIYAEGGKIVLCYADKHTLTHSGTPWFGAVDVYTKVSNDYGATWGSAVLLSYSGVVLQASNWRATTPTVCISSGAILVFVYGGTWDANTYHILRSDDDGASWSIVYSFPALVPNYGYDCQFMSDGDHVVFSGCGMTIGEGNPMVYFESFDAGLTWAAIEVVPESAPQILVPA
jgi:hypothetical protein